MTSLVDVVLDASKQGDIYDPDRTVSSIMFQVMEEVGELSTEISIVNGTSYKKPSADGVVGEAIDAIVALLDLIYRFDPLITEEEISLIAKMKCDKWISKIQDEAGPPWYE